MKTIFKIITVLITFSASMAYGALEDHNGQCHDKVNAKVPGCKLCDTMSQNLGK